MSDRTDESGHLCVSHLGQDESIVQTASETTPGPGRNVADETKLQKSSGIVKFNNTITRDCETTCTCHHETLVQYGCELACTCPESHHEEQVPEPQDIRPRPEGAPSVWPEPQSFTDSGFADFNLNKITSKKRRSRLYNNKPARPSSPHPIFAEGGNSGQYPHFIETGQHKQRQTQLNQHLRTAKNHGHDWYKPSHTPQKVVPECTCHPYSDVMNHNCLVNYEHQINRKHGVRSVSDYQNQPPRKNGVMPVSGYHDQTPTRKHWVQSVSRKTLYLSDLERKTSTSSYGDQHWSETQEGGDSTSAVWSCSEEQSTWALSTSSGDVHFRSRRFHKMYSSVSLSSGERKSSKTSWSKRSTEDAHAANDAQRTVLQQGQRQQRHPEHVWSGATPQTVVAPGPKTPRRRKPKQDQHGYDADGCTCQCDGCGTKRKSGSRRFPSQRTELSDDLCFSSPNPAPSSPSLMRPAKPMPHQRRNAFDQRVPRYYDEVGMMQWARTGMRNSESKTQPVIHSTPTDRRGLRGATTSTPNNGVVLDTNRDYMYCISDGYQMSSDALNRNGYIVSSDQLIRRISSANRELPHWSNDVFAVGVSREVIGQEGGDVEEEEDKTNYSPPPINVDTEHIRMERTRYWIEREFEGIYAVRECTCTCVDQKAVSHTYVLGTSCAFCDDAIISEARTD